MAATVHNTTITHEEEAVSVTMTLSEARTLAAVIATITTGNLASEKARFLDGLHSDLSHVILGHSLSRIEAKELHESSDRNNWGFF